MAERDRNPETSIIGRDADAAKGGRGRDVRMAAAAEDTDGGCEELEIVFEREEPTTTH